MKSSASASKAFQSRSKGEIPGRARRKERLSRSKLKQAFLIDSDGELFMYRIQCIRFGLMKSTASEPGLSASVFPHLALATCHFLHVVIGLLDLSASCCDWFVGLSASVVIGLLDCLRLL